MSTFLYIIIIGCVIVFTGLLSGLLMLWTSPHLPVKNSRESLPFITIIIPARNEAKRLPFLLRSIQKQNFRSFEIIVVDDDSSDATADVARQYGAKVLQNDHVKQGESGKSHACWKGAKYAQGTWLLFLDADTQFMSTSGLETLLGAYQQHNAEGLFSIQPYHIVEKPYEQLSAIFNLIVLVGMNIFTARGKKLPSAGAFGPCILCDRAEYFKAGGHEKAKTAIMDDFALAQAFKSIDLPVYCYGGAGILSFRMYPEGIKQLTEGWTKNFSVASQATHWSVMLLISLWICGAFVTACGFILSFWQASWMIVLACINYGLYALETAYLVRKTGNFHGWIFLLFPLLFLFFTGVRLYSTYRAKVLRNVSWKGRKLNV